jgi:hypothetical protein
LKVNFVVDDVDVDVDGVVGVVGHGDGDRMNLEMHVVAVVVDHLVGLAWVILYWETRRL